MVKGSAGQRGALLATSWGLAMSTGCVGTPWSMAGGGGGRGWGDVVVFGATSKRGLGASTFLFGARGGCPRVQSITEHGARCAQSWEEV